MITFTPLSGGARSFQSTPLAYLLQVDDVHILLDCGSPDWCSDFLEQPSQFKIPPWNTYCQNLKELSPKVDLVLISHGDLLHAGLYPYAYSNWGLRAPAYATLPVQSLARIAILEDVENIRAQETIDELDFPGAIMDMENGEVVRQRKYIASIKQVNDAFDSINVLRFSQPIHLQGKCQGLTITAFNAGHTLGGSIWKIRSPSSGTILYAVNLNHAKERHLDGTVMIKSAGVGGIFEPLARPDLLITDADRAMSIASKRKDRDAQLIDTITATLSSRHSILMPCDASSRVLELLVLLDQLWNHSRLKYPICLISRTGREMLTFVRSMMEWLGGTINKEDVGEDVTGADNSHKRKRDYELDDGSIGAFALRFRHLEFFTNPQELLRTYSSKDPKLILAVPASLSYGPSRMLFSEFATIPDNVIILTSRTENGTLGRTLFNMWNDQQRDEDKWDSGKLGRNVMLDGVITLRMHSKIPLQGAELEDYLQKERTSKEKEVAQRAALERTQRMLEADEDDTDSDDTEDEDVVEQSLGHTNAGEIVPTFAEPGAGSHRRRDREIIEIVDWSNDFEESGIKHLLSYDIYLKGNVSKTTSFFKATGSQAQKFRMFPYAEKKRRVDSYGEVIDIGMWLRKGKIWEEEAKSDESKEIRRRQTMEEEAKRPVEVPSKFINFETEVQLACRLLFVDMEGVNDGRAVKSIVPHVNPRKMIIVHASNEATTTLIEACASIRTMTKDIFSPSLKESLQIGQHTNTFAISLSEELLTSVKMSKFEDNEVGLIAGRITSYPSSTIPILESLSSEVDYRSLRDQTIPSYRSVWGSRFKSNLPRSTMIGDLKLTILKARLALKGIQAEFAGEGILICRDKGGTEAEEYVVPIVSVKKLGQGSVAIEGTVSDVFYAVRKEVYELHAVIAT